MEELISYQNNLLSQVNDTWFRYLYDKLKSEERLLGIKGLRGVGKTTLLLQYMKYGFDKPDKALYVTADHPYFYQNTLFELAAEWYRYGGELLLIDEVHKYPDWSREIKLIYDGHPKLKVIFTSSSALDLYRGESDLSRRLITQTLQGMSFREYLSLMHNMKFEAADLQQLLKGHQKISREVCSNMKPLPLFKEYLKGGYFPFIVHQNADTLGQRLIQVINTVLESDLSYIQDFSTANIIKIKKLLGVIASVAPFEPNISKIAQKLHLGRDTVNHYLRHLHDAYIVILANKPSKSISNLQKPDKIYIENTAFAYALQNVPEIGTIRETFFINQLRNAGYTVNLSDRGDFLINEKWTFEIGGRNKDNNQISNMDDAFLALDEIETGFNNKIPLWLFGFLY